MSERETQLDRLIALLGGWPDYFEDLEKRHGESILAVLVARQVIDQGVFGIVVRYAVHRAAFDRLSEKLASAEEVATGNSFLSGDEQRRAFHENKLVGIEDSLLATPYARAKAGEKVQTDFLKLLDGDPSPDNGGGADGEAAGTGKKNVHPFKPMSRKVKGA